MGKLFIRSGTPRQHLYGRQRVFQYAYWLQRGITEETQFTVNLIGKDAEIKDLTVAGAIGNIQTNCVGAIAGVNRGKISHCTVSASLDSTVGAVGVLEGNRDGITGGSAGIAGINYGEISPCAYSGTIKSSVGGAGFAVINNGTVSLCSFTGTLGAANTNETGNSTKAYFSSRASSEHPQ